MEVLFKTTPQLIQLPKQKAKSIDSSVLSFGCSPVTSLALTIITITTFDHFFGYSLLYNHASRFSKKLGPDSKLKRTISSLLRFRRNSSPPASPGKATRHLSVGSPQVKRAGSGTNLRSAGSGVFRVDGMLTFTRDNIPTEPRYRSPSISDKKLSFPPFDEGKNCLYVCTMKIADI